MLLAYENGVTSVILRLWITDPSTGLGKTALTTGSTGLNISTIANNESTATAYSGSNLETISTLGTFAAPTSGKARFKEVDATNHPGMYEVQIADARWAVSNARYVDVQVTVTGYICPPARVQLKEIPSDLKLWRGSQPNALQSGRIDSYLGAVASGVIAAESFASGALDAVWSTATRTLTSISDSSGVTTLLSRLSATRAGYLDNLSGGAVALASKLKRYVQLLARKDSAIATDAATELSEINENVASGAGAYANTTDAAEAQRDNVGTNGAALAVALAASQPNYAPAKAGDAMTLTSPYDAAKTAAQAGDAMTVAPGGIDAPSFAVAAIDSAALAADAIAEIQLGLSVGFRASVALEAFPFLMVASSNHITPATGLTVTAERALDGGSFAPCANAVTETGSGVYTIDLDASDLNGQRFVTLKFSAAGADTRVITLTLVP